MQRDLLSITLASFIGKVGGMQQFLVYGCISVPLCQCVSISSSQFKLSPQRLCHIQLLINELILYSAEICMCYLL